MDFSDFLVDIGLFTLKLALAVFGVVMVIGAIANAARSGSSGPAGKLKAQRLDKRWRDYGRTLLRASNRKKELKRLEKEDKALEEARSKHPRPRVFVCRFDGNAQATGVARLAEQVNAFVQEGVSGDEVVIRLKSPGGLVYSYGHAASQLERIRDAGLRLTVAVDEVAASGGYLMAAMAHQILAAPFAIVGSIGVIAQVPNVHRFLKKRDIDVELHTAGRYKRTLTFLGENTDEGRAKFQADLLRTHELFKSAVTKYRTTLDLEKVATGEYWYGSEALELGLIDRVSTSDAYLIERSVDADIIAVGFAEKRGLVGRLMQDISLRAGRGVERGLTRAADKALTRAQQPGNSTYLM